MLIVFIHMMIINSFYHLYRALKENTVIEFVLLRYKNLCNVKIISEIYILYGRRSFLSNVITVRVYLLIVINLNKKLKEIYLHARHLPVGSTGKHL